MIIADITSCLFQNIQIDWFTTQFIVGMKALFREWIAKHWKDLEKSQNRVMKSMNKIVIKQCVVFYSKAWRQRNEVFNDSENYRKFIIE